MTGVQLSVGWAVAQAAEALSASPEQIKRGAGNSLRCCEVVGLDRLNREDPAYEPNTQGVRVKLRFYRESDLDAVTSARAGVAVSIALALGLWKNGAVQLDMDLLDDDHTWLGIERPYQTGGTGKRLDRYLTSEVLGSLKRRVDSADWKHLAQRPGEVKILLRRLRYRLGEDYGAASGTPRYGYWTTDTTKRWAREGRHQLDYLVNKLSSLSGELKSGHAAPADSLDPGFWGEVDTEVDRLRVRQLTTYSGVTVKDVSGVLKHARDQINLRKTQVTGSSDANDPVRCFVDALTDFVAQPTLMKNTDILLVHRGGGVNPTDKRNDTNVSDTRKRQLWAACEKIRDHGVEVVVALGHANISVLDSSQKASTATSLGIFEATTPTAGAAWILQEHINPRIADTSLIYSQPHNR